MGTFREEVETACSRVVLFPDLITFFSGFVEVDEDDKEDEFLLKRYD